MGEYLAGLLAEKGTDHQADPPHLHEARPDGEIQSGQQQESHQGGIPHDIIQGAD